MKPYLFDFSLDEWKSWCNEHAFPSFTAKQIYQWLFKKCAVDPALFTNLSQSQRDKLFSTFTNDLVKIDSHLVSQDESEKFLLKTHDNLLFEMVIMPYENRVTLCLSSQVGCKMGCTFCQTGKMGFKRNLSSGEILFQLIYANAHLKDKKISNVVFMGMGEPLDNFDEVVKAASIMIDKEAFGLSASRVTISTSGLVPEIRKLAEKLPLRLAISLHSADEEKRTRMMPINRTYSLAILKEALLEYPAGRFGITFEYVMIEGVNDSLQDAKKLVHFLHGLKAKVNLIPINHFPGIEMRPSQAAALREFQLYLTHRSISAPVRYSRGQDISGGCGQLAAKRKDELLLDPRKLQRDRRQKER